MRQITRDAIEAFNNNRPFKNNNTRVTSNGSHTELLLHGHCIAWKTAGNLFINDCGWQTATTKERLNAIDGVDIYQKNFVWYLTTPKHDNVEMQSNTTYEV